METLANVLEPHLHGPFAFFGHSMGALIAYELTRYLRRQRSRMPVHLFVSGRGAPHLPLAELSHSLPTPAFLQRVQRLNGIPPAVLEDEEMLQLFLPVLRADFELCETYVHRQEPDLACPISVFGGVRDPEVSTESLQAWREHTSGPFRLKLFEGDHFYLTTEPRPLVQAVADCLYQDVYGS